MFREFLTKSWISFWRIHSCCFFSHDVPKIFQTLTEQMFIWLCLSPKTKFFPYFFQAYSSNPWFLANKTSIYKNKKQKQKQKQKKYSVFSYRFGKIFLLPNSFRFKILSLLSKQRLLYVYWCLLVGRVFSNGLGDVGSTPGHVIPKTLKIVLGTALLNTQQYKVRIKGKVEQSRERSSTLPYTSV